MAKILVTTAYTPSLINFRGPMLDRFQELGHEVAAASPDSDSEADRNAVRELERRGFRHYTIPLTPTGMSPAGDLRTYRAMRELFEAEKPDHMLAYMIKPVIWGCRAARTAGVPHVHALITGLGTSFQPGGLRQYLLSGLVSLLYRRALRGCERVFFQNPDDRQLFLERGLVASGPTRLVNGSGIDLDHFAHQPVPAGAPRFLLVARLLEEKGIRLYAEAARRIRAEFPEARFRLVGYMADPPRGVPAAEIEAWQAEGVIEYLGPTNDVRPYLEDCSVFCLPTWYREGVPRSILEALSVGRAVITTDAPGCRETVVEGENGHLVRPRDVESLVRACRKVCQQENRIAAMGEVSRRLAEEKFDVRKVNAVLCEGMGLF